MNSDLALIALGKDEPQSISFVRWLTDVELRGYTTRADFLRELVAARMPFRSMLYAHRDFLQYVSRVERSDLASLATHPRHQWETPLNRSFDGVLTSMRGYVDQTRFRLSHGGAESAKALKLWDTSRKARHKRSAAYRIAYGMRDYVQHGRPALTATTITGSWNQATRTAHHTFELACSRDALLQSGFEWKRVKMDIEALQPVFDPRPILQDAIGELVELDHELFFCQMDRLKEAISWIEALLAQADSSRDPLMGTVGKMEVVGQDATTGARVIQIKLNEPPSIVEWP